MKYANLQAFEKHLESAAPKHFSPIYTIIIKDRFMRKAAADATAKALLGNQRNPDLSLKVFDEHQLNASAISEEMQTLTLFADCKIIRLDLPEKPSTSALKELLECLKSTPGVFVIISASAINHATTFYKQIEKVGVVLEFPEEKAWEKEKNLVTFVAKQVAAAGKIIDPDASLYLAKQFGTDGALLYNETEKLITYVGDRNRISLQDVSAICAQVNIENSWQLGEAIFRRDGKTALRITTALLQEGTPFLALLRQIRHQVQTDYTVCSILTNGGTQDDISRQFPYMRGFILERHVRTASDYGMVRFKRAMQEIDAMELMVKNSGIEHNLLAEIIITKLVR
ncbi:MAG: DNA polymerase III subunit delta [Parachlamydiaceae bacterium]|nr:DNA polymerase III subunit delta [Parachlamydiaceae bacterium]